MKLPAQIVELLTSNPGMTSSQISTRLNAKVNTIKVTLNKMIKTNRVVREKTRLTDKTGVGPRNVFSYRLAEVKSETSEPA